MLVAKDISKDIGKNVSVDVSAPPAVTMYGVNGFLTTAAYGTVAGSGENGNAVSGFTVNALISVDSQAVASSDRWITGVSDSTGTSYDWQLRSTGTNAGLSFGVRVSGGGAQIFSSTFTVTAAMLGRILHVTGVVDLAAGKMRFYVDGGLVGVESVVTTYGVPDTASPDTIGRLVIGGSGFVPASGITLYGRATGHGPMTQAEVAAHRALCLSAGDIVALSGVGLTPRTTHSVKAAVIAAGSTASAPTTIPDSTGTATMTKVGSPTLNIRSNPPWA